MYVLLLLPGTILLPMVPVPVIYFTPLYNLPDHLNTDKDKKRDKDAAWIT
jgi:hypothetical protein